MVSPKQLLITPITFYTGMQSAFIVSEMTRAYASCLLGVEQVRHAESYWTILTNVSKSATDVECNRHLAKIATVDWQTTIISQPIGEIQHDVSLFYCAGTFSSDRTFITNKVILVYMVLLRSEIPSGMCSKLRAAAASNNRVHMPWSLSAYASRYVQSFTS